MGTETWGQTERFPDFSDIFFCPMTRLRSFLPRGANQGHRNPAFFFRTAVSSHFRISTEIQASLSFLTFHKFLGGAMRHYSPCASSSGLIGFSQTQSGQISRPDSGFSTVAFDFMTHTLSKNQ